MTSSRGTAQTPTEEVARRLRTRLDDYSSATPSRLPVHPALASLLPDGLRQGAAYALSQPGALLLALLAEPSRAGSWCGVVGLPELGAEAAGLAGVELSRLALIPRPGDRWLAVTAALAEVLPIVAVRPSGNVREADAARLAARLRNRGTVLLTIGPWPQAEASLTLSEPDWSGLGAGHGYLTERRVTVSMTSKRSPLPRRVRLALPDRTGLMSVASDTASIPVADGLRAVG